MGALQWGVDQAWVAQHHDVGIGCGAPNALNLCPQTCHEARELRSGGTNSRLAGGMTGNETRSGKINESDVVATHLNQDHFTVARNVAD